MSATIYNKQGEVVFTTPINKGSKAKFTLMQEDYVTLVFSVESPIRFNLGDYFNYFQDNRFIRRFEIIDLVNCKPNKSTGGYDYELRMDAYYWKWKNKIFKYYSTTNSSSKETSWNITATIDVIMSVFFRNLNDYGYKHYAGNIDYVCDVSTLENASEAKLVTFNNTNMIDALNAIAEAWQCEWWVTDNIIHFGKCEFGDNYVPLHTLTHDEVPANVDEMSRSGNRATYATRIFAYGSDRNLPYNYRQTDNTDVVNAIVQKRLMLPEDKPYIDAYRYVSGKRVYIGESGYEDGTEMPQEEAIESSITFDAIYPRSTVTITEIQTDEMTDTIVNEDGSETTEKWMRYRIKLSFASQFKENYILEGKTLRISFESGLLNGMDFDVAFNPDKVDENGADSQWFEIVRNEDYGRKLPDDVLKPEVGDSVVLYNWNIALMPTDDLSFISKAENELHEEAVKELKKMMIDPNNYNCKMMSDVMLGYDLKTHTANPDNALTLDIGQRVLLLNDAYFENGERKSRIIGYEYNLDMLWDSPSFIVGESVSVGRLNALESKVENLTIKGVSSRGNGGGNNIYIIGSNDITKATDRNVYSALRTDKSFARKDMNDTIQAIWSFYKYLQSKGFNSGVLGSGWFLGFDQYDDNNEGINSHLEVDTLKIRKKAMFDTLEIKHVAHVGGELMLSPAGATLTKVETYLSEYKCYFRNDDGTDAVTNQFKVGDLVMCKTFNLDGSQRYYWRRCINKGIGDDGMAYVYLSKSMCDQTVANDIPIAGDVIVTVGNATDVARQNAIIISSYATGAPSISLYQGINSFELPESKMPVRISPILGNKFTGEFYIQILSDDGTQQVLSLAEFLENRISLGINSAIYDEECVENANPKESSDLHEIDLNDNAKSWRKGDIIDLEIGIRALNMGPIDLLIYGEEATGITLSPNGDYQFLLYDPSGNAYDTTWVTSFVMAEDWEDNFNGYGYAYFVLEATDAVEIGPISVKKRSLQGELKRTGIDIENGNITLDAQTTTLKDGDKEIAVFTTDDNGNAILSTELIDANEIKVDKLTTKGIVNSGGKRVKFIDIKQSQMTAFDESGIAKVYIHGGTLQSKSTSAAVSSAYLGSINTLSSANNNLKINISNVFNVKDETMLFIFNAITGTMTLNLREYASTEPAPQSATVKARLYYAESESLTMEAIEMLAEQKFSLFGVDVPSTQALNLKLNIYNRTLSKGYYRVVLEVYVAAPHNDSFISISANPGVRGTKSTQMQEIATDGYHFSYGDSSIQKYQKANSDNFEVMFAPYGLRVSVNGIQITKNNGSTWINL